MDFHVTVDFNDDILFARAEWTEEALRELVRGYAERDIRAVHWIDYGGLGDGFWDAGAGSAWSSAAGRFVERVPDPLAVVADECHRRGIRAYSVLKVFDLAMGMPWSNAPVGVPPEGKPRLAHIGGTGGSAMRAIVESPGIRSRLHPSLIAEARGRPIRTIRLWHESARLGEVGPPAIFVSTDNGSYALYDGPAEFSQSVRRRRPPRFVPAPDEAWGDEGEFSCIEITGLDIRQPFMAVTPSGPTGMANTLAAMCDVEDDRGRAVGFTYGLIPVHGREWQSGGIAFDAAFGTPVPGRGWTNVASGGRTRVELDRLEVLGIARGRNEYLTAVLELAEPGARDLLLGMIRHAADVGVDGVDIRPSTHTESLDWENYGFNEPVVREFLNRYSVDIARESFDRAAWRSLRGEHFDRFLEAASEELRSRGLEILVHLSNPMDARPDEITWLEICWDWRRWLRSGLVDGATFKTSGKDAFYRAAVTECDRAGIPRTAIPWMSDADDEKWRREARSLVMHAIEERFATFNIYESANVSRLEADGKVCFTAPALWEVIGEVLGR